MPSIIKVLVVDDSALIRQMLTRALGLDPRLEVVGTAKTGVEAIEKSAYLVPDVVTLDIEMPELSGLEALPHIVRATPARVIMLSSVDDPDTTYQALASGAVDFIPKPKGGFATSLGDLTDYLIKKIKVAYRIPPEKRLQANTPILESLVKSRVERVVPVLHSAALELEKYVVVASSTGGPPALENVFSGLSRDLPATFFVVQHLPPGFTQSLARRLSKVTDLEIVEGENGMEIQAGRAYIAPYGKHMTVESKRTMGPRIRLEEGEPLHGVQPAADPLMKSVAQQFTEDVVGVVLTGMGADGADGLASVRAHEGLTIVQDEETSVVWGMPGAAVRKGAAQYVVPLNEIAAEIRRAVRGGAAR